MDHPAPRIAGLSYVRAIGRGGYADVYLYQQAVPMRQVAVKVLRDTGLRADVRSRFESEANTMALLQGHPHIASVFMVGVAEDHRPYIAMQYYPGATLADGRRHPVADVLRIGIKIASAVETAHRAGLLHRDIKPHNILIDQWQTPVLTDFGIAAHLADTDADVGISVPWSPPEVLYASAAPSVQSDVYSLAATLWHLLAGRSPFETAGGDNGDAALTDRIRALDPPRTARPDVPASLERLLQLGMAKHPARRPRSAMEFARWLQFVEQELGLPPTRIDVAEGALQQPVLDAERHPRTSGAGPAQAAAGPAFPADQREESMDRTRMRGRSPDEERAPDRGRTHATYTAEGAWAAPGHSQPSRGSYDRPQLSTAGQPQAADVLTQRQSALPVAEPQTTIRATKLVDGAVAEPRPVATPRLTSGRVPLIIAGLILLLALTAIIAVLLSRDSTPQSAASSDPATLETPALTADDSIQRPGPVTVRFGARTGDSVLVTWTYANRLPDDTVEYRLGDGQVRTATAFVDGQQVIRIVGKAPACIRIRIVRAASSASAGNPFSARTCETG